VEAGDTVKVKCTATSPLAPPCFIQVRSVNVRGNGRSFTSDTVFLVQNFETKKSIDNTTYLNMAQAEKALDQLRLSGICR
jgi:hypothetical protein